MKNEITERVLELLDTIAQASAARRLRHTPGWSVLTEEMRATVGQLSRTDEELGHLAREASELLMLDGAARGADMEISKGGTNMGAGGETPNSEGGSGTSESPTHQHDEAGGGVLLPPAMSPAGGSMWDEIIRVGCAASTTYGRAIADASRLADVACGELRDRDEHAAADAVFAFGHRIFRSVPEHARFGAVTPDGAERARVLRCLRKHWEEERLAELVDSDECEGCREERRGAPTEPEAAPAPAPAGDGPRGDDPPAGCGVAAVDWRLVPESVRREISRAAAERDETIAALTERIGRLRNLLRAVYAFRRDGATERTCEALDAAGFGFELWGTWRRHGAVGAMGKLYDLVGLAMTDDEEVRA